jgi:hypothetical protein
VGILGAPDQLAATPGAPDRPLRHAPSCDDEGVLARGMDQQKEMWYNGRMKERMRVFKYTIYCMNCKFERVSGCDDYISFRIGAIQTYTCECKTPDWYIAVIADEIAEHVLDSSPTILFIDRKEDGKE